MLPRMTSIFLNVNAKIYVLPINISCLDSIWYRLLIQEMIDDTMYTQKALTLYKLKGRLFAVMAVIGTVGFILFLTQFYSTDRRPKVEFSLASELNRGLNIEGTAAPNMNKSLLNDIYAIVFDAGSTGSRVHIYKFQTSQDKPLELLHETFEEVKPGLSSYAADPLKAAHSLDGMLETCVREIPKHLQSRTPLILKATAGLRLLQEGQADNILNEVTAHLKKFPFKLVENGVGIMDGVDEGVFSWITVNFMLGLLSDSGHPEPALDLGGGSTQITFVPTKPETTKHLRNEFMKNVILFKNEYKLYTHSYLGYGLMSARFTITGGDSLTGNNPARSFLTSVCIPPGYSGNYTHSGKVYKLRGTSPGQFKYDHCASEMKSLVDSQIRPVIELSGNNLYLFSYFFDRAVEANLIDKSGGVVSAVDFKNAAIKAFKVANIEMPFQALDLTYIYSLLHYGYHISDSTQIHLKKKINSVEVSWGLGAAFQLLMQVGLVR
ncbi:ectonucleoside triphosphate diphosphohydrolase 5-like [Mercenaria mercenaria]|uniref:ectonucleoside triphosphate diphosphohydrolase 5-like n=1 Tax=Mercenaria mercenaria TaxID=6596 RepID=UPI00234F00EE|nr:ectonucleoside triphosphate diphosphohydrolase 5-like [Mercenaria mercenaria]